MTTLSKAYQKDLINSHPITPIDFGSIDRVPESHLWSQTNEVYQKIQTDHDIQEALIPVIDLAHLEAMDLIGQACKTWGMFQVINHGVPSDLVKNIESEVQRLFELPTHEKCKVLRSASRLGGYGSAQISPYFDKAMWHEGFTIMGSCVEDAKILWPNDFQRFCDTIDAYRNQMKLLAHKLVTMILQTLDATQEEMNWATSTLDAQNNLQLNSYPSCPNPSSVVGLASHTDTRLLTILHQSSGINGLEIFVEGLGWKPVRPVENAFVVNVGDLLHIFSNATFPAVYHRVMVNQSKHRTSVAYFYSPLVESMVAPSSKFKNPCFKSLTVKEYLSLKAKSYHKALSMVRI
uniref:gibberellin 3-beta-dioxygenase 1-like n=1 Tax=Erigeron canadensis TaxID=72917 RepID=UPI001CB8A366|nr:gibberellin 3-beta-dioxygenase 1-like [Erigeron canadensis]